MNAREFSIGVEKALIQISEKMGKVSDVGTNDLNKQLGKLLNKQQWSRSDVLKLASIFFALYHIRAKE